MNDSAEGSATGTDLPADVATLTRTVARFAPDGPLSEVVPGYRYREVQAQLAAAIASALEIRRHALLEAGTGTGKTWAYLLALAEQPGTALIATGSLTLQDQLWFQDLPRLKKLLPAERRIARLKGRGNYLCPERLEKSLKVADVQVPADVTTMLYDVRRWSSATTTGDLGEIEGSFDPRAAPLITSTRDNCLGGNCPSVERCPLYRARAAAQDADLVIINHHLLLADLTLRDESLGRILPDTDAIVVDEAHQLASVARQFLGTHVGTGQLLDLCQDVERERLAGEWHDEALAEVTSDVSRQVRQLGIAMSRETESIELPAFVARHGPALENLDMAMGDLATALRVTADRSPAMAHLGARAERLLDEFVVATEAPQDNDLVGWVQPTTRGFIVHMNPLDVSRELAPRIEETGSTWLFLSATLSVGGDFGHIRDALGLANPLEATFESPFDYKRQVLPVVPDLVANPGSDAHTLELIDWMMPLLAHKTLFLVTSYRALSLVAEKLAPAHTVFVQGTESRNQLLERFRAAAEGVLIATMGFWEGVDLRGAALGTVVIDKLPFANPNEPLNRAMMEAHAAQGRDAFAAFMVPEAVISLRQGFGRLIRQEEDRGVFVLGDHRVLTKPYGATVLGALPEMNWTRDVENALSFIEEDK